ncbi:stress-induced protein, KGG, repeat-containing protein [Domibacillus antri]|uniref:Stress-induced protein, KGG, repeat-containing protein n=1 Tax=Domibacillus antri TaxID=1714264 RepID=A0A1Q8Q3Q9_9BACI|nr:KGG domain-containing protein [Domibacillus antri]OLN21932.1 stress-induced protein, KGG, repeat-containing protein [Domibacillus antri]
MANRNNDNGGKMSREEAGRMGGEATAKKHDKEFFQEIGEKGGEATARNHDKEFYQEIGEKGGKSNNNRNNN